MTYMAPRRRIAEDCKNYRRGVSPFSRVICHDNVATSIRYVTRRVGVDPVEGVKISDRFPKVRRSVATIIPRSNSLPGAAAAVGDPLNAVKISGVDEDRGYRIHEICAVMEGNDRGSRVSKNHLMPFEKGCAIANGRTWF